MALTEVDSNNPDLYLQYLCERGAAERFGPDWETAERRVRLDYEMGVIQGMGFSGYFVILAQIMAHCRQEGIPYGPGRGSVGGCFVAYCARITEVDPLEWGLLFERFLTRQRVGYPDVDLDFSQERRGEVLDFIRTTYEDRVYCATEPLTLTIVPCAPDARPGPPSQDTRPATVAVLTHGRLTALQAARLESVVIESGQSCITDPEKLSERLGESSGTEYAERFWNTTVAAVPAAETPLSTFSNWTTSTAMAPKTGASIRAMLTSACEQRGSPTESRSSAPTVTEPRLVLVDARITLDQQNVGNVVLQVAAYARAGARSVVDAMLNATGQEDPQAGAVAASLKKCLPPGSATGGQKVEHELAWWLANGHGDKDRFRELAEQAGWLDTMLKLDGMLTHLARHAAGVVILAPEDLRVMPRTSADGVTLMTGFDMYDLDALHYLKYDILGLRTLDVVTEAHRLAGGDGLITTLMDEWREHRDDPEPYRLLCEADTLGIFQMETPGYRRTLRDFQPSRFDHIVQLNALYRPGALDYRDESGRNMVEVFIERHHSPHMAHPPHPALRELLAETHGVILYQEQSMQIARQLAGFTMAQADALRKAIGKKRSSEMLALKQRFLDGCAANGIKPAVADGIWENIAAAQRYSWNKSHAVEYAIITWWTAWLKAREPAAFYAALLNSYDSDKDRMGEAIAEARQRVELEPPNINVAQEGFTVRDGRIVFGLNGVRGIGEGNRQLMLAERTLPFGSYQDFCQRLPSFPVSMKLSLVQAGAFDELDQRELLLARTVKPGKAQKVWTVAEHLNHNRTLKQPRPVPPLDELDFPTDRELAEGELASVGFYVSSEPLADVSKALARLNGNHWGGQVEAVRTKADRRGNEMGFVTLMTPALSKQRVVVFASVWDRFRGLLTRGARVIVRGREDGDAVLAEAFFAPDDMRHFRKVRASRDGAESIEDLPAAPDERAAKVLELEAYGYRTKLM